MHIELIGYFLIFVSGLFIGSFLNVVSDRLQNGESIIFGRSHCDSCKKTLKPVHMLPILSFLMLKGKCAFCKKPVSLYYLASELFTGLSYMSVAYYFKVFENPSFFSWYVFFFVCFIFSLFVVITMSDLKYRIIPNKISYLGILSAALFLVLNSAVYLISTYFALKNDEFGRYLLEAGFFNIRAVLILKSLFWNFASSLVIAGFFWFLIFVTKGRGMGGGDVKLALLIGLFNTFPLNILAIFMGFLSGAVVSLLLILIRKKSIKDTIPFGPFLIFGSLASFFFGSWMLDLYFGLF